MFGFALKENVSVNLNFGKLSTAFPPYIKCTGKNLAERVIPKVPVIACLYINPARCTCLEFSVAIARLETGAYLKVFSQY